MHFTDLHYDNRYVAGTDVLCNLPLCCRAVNGFPTDPARQAGPWGNYIESSIRSMLQFIKSDIKPNMIFWTGDNAPHDMWDSSL